MLQKNIQVAIRYLFKNKLSATINITGLSISILLTIQLSLFVINELSYDRFHKNHDRIFRILSELSIPGERTELYSICQGQLPLVINGVVLEVEACVRIYYNDRIAFEFNDKRFNDNHIIYTDSTFFDVFSFKLFSGNPHQDLSTKGNLYVSKSLALKVFGKADVAGKFITTKNKTYTIAGVFADIPKNSHLQFDLISGISGSEVEGLVKHSGLEFLTYIELKKNINKEIGLKKVCDKYDEFLKGFWANRRFKCVGRAQLLTNIWLHSNNVSNDVSHGNINNIYIACVLIAFILLIAIVNFINLAIIQAEDRAKEIGIRKMSGASPGNIRHQFMSEAFLTIFLSVIFALILTKLTQPIFNNLTGKLISLSFSNTTKLFFAIVSLCLIIGIIAGFYPSLHLAKFPVTTNLKGGSPEGKETSTFSKVLVFLQFSIVIFLISNLLVFYKQMKFIRNSDMGFQMEQVVGITDQNGGIYKSYEAIKQSLLQNPGILNVCLAQGISSEDMSGQYVKSFVDGETKELLVKQTRTTYDFIRTFKIKLIEGRDFDISMSTDNHAFIINETAKKDFNLPSYAIGQQLVLGRDTGKVIGVMKDFHYASLHDKIEPLILTMNKPNLNNPLWGIIFIRLKPGYITEGLKFITQTIQKIDHHYILEYEFVDDHFNAQYKSDSKINNMIFFATVISVLIALMGLVALTSITVAKRTKEIGIRKIFGKSVSGIVILLLSDIIKWVLLANVIALPISYFIMQKWLLNFAYRINFPFSALFFAGIMAAVIASLAIINKVFKTAIQNPINSLRYE